MIAKVALNIPYSIPYDYLIPEPYQQLAGPGKRVLVPFGARRMIGVIVEIASTSEVEGLKPVLAMVDEEPIFSATMMGFTRWISSYYLCSWGEVLEAALPTSLKPRLTKTVVVDRNRLDHFSLSQAERDWLEDINGNPESELSLQKKEPGVNRLVSRMKKQKVIGTSYCFSAGSSGEQREEWLVFQLDAGTGITGRKGSIASRLLDLFKAERELPFRTALERIPKSRAAINRMVSQGMLVKESRYLMPAACPATVNDHLFLEPNAEQQTAIHAILEGIQTNAYRAYLLHGVTGSGKTEIYLHVVRETIKRGKTVLILIPEISLTPQVVSRFRERFGERIAVLHSGMADGERSQQWWKIKQRTCDIVVGARSAIFAPLEHIGLIVVDEEHDTSFKQQESPYYNARDAAVKLASDQGAAVILGSATPSIETYSNVKGGKYILLELKQRVNRQQLPLSELIDLKEEKRQKGAFYLSRRLVDHLKENLGQGKQALLFLNRRGYAAFLSCTACEQPILCRNCSIALTWHRSRQRLICHHCGFSQGYPVKCPQCKAVAFHLEGIGTQRVERDLKLLFPDARFLRMDRDTVRKRGALEKNIDKINDRQVDFIVGTQLISKGHDFKHIGIVCMILADMSLNIPDFRSSERSFQLISQVSGRAGRSEESSGLALIQSYNPGHFAFQTAIKHDFQGFYDQEMMLRRDLQNPPLMRQILVKISDRNPKQAENTALELGRVFSQSAASANYFVMGPAEAPLQKINNRYYWQILIKSEEITKAKKVIRELMFSKSGQRIKSGTRVSIDVDPMTML